MSVLSAGSLQSAANSKRKHQRVLQLSRSLYKCKKAMIFENKLTTLSEMLWPSDNTVLAAALYVTTVETVQLC